MTIDRERVKALARRELERRLSSSSLPMHRNPALLELISSPECSEDPDFPVRRPCRIEPHRPCYNSGYCKKLGY